MADPRVIDTLSRVSVERILQEWLKAMKADQPSVAFSIMREAGMLQACCPSLAAITEIRWRDTMQLLDRCPDDPALRFAALLHATKQPQSVTKALKMSNEMRAGISAIIDPQPLQYAPTWSDADLRRFLRSVSQKDLPRILTLSTLMAELGLEQGNAHVSELSSRIDEERKRATPLSTKQLAINGGTLIQTLQLKPGRIVGQLLEALLERVTDDPELNTRDALLNEARRIASERDL